MVSASRTEGGPQILSAGVRKTIQSIKEIVGNHSDAEIYITLKETNMDPNETTQKLLNQDPFHVVKRKRDKRKEVATNKVHTASQPRTHTEHLNQGPKFNTHAEHIIRRGGFVRNSLPDAKVSIEFRVVRDNRTNHDANGEIKPPSLQGQISANEVDGPKLSEKSNLVAPNNQKQPLGRPSSQSSIFTDIQPRQARDVQLSDKKDSSEGKPLLVSKAGPQVQTGKANDSQPNTATSSNNSVAGVYSSSSDPVHVPSPDSRPAANIGAIKREVGAVGRRLSTEGSPKISSAQSGLSPNSHLGRDGPLRDSLRSSTATSKSSQPKQAPVHELATRSNSINRPIMGNHNISRQHQVVGHQKASSQSNKEWKPKSSRKQSSGPGIIGAPAKSSSPSADASKNLEADSTQLQANVSRIKVAENQNVIIAPHIRVSETDRCRVTFGSLGTELEQSRNPGFQAGEVAEETHIDASASISNATPESSGDESSGSKQVELLDERGGNSGTRSPASAAVSEQQSTDRKESSNPQDLDNYADVGLVRDSSPSYTLSESQQQQDPPQLPIFSAYEAQTMYDIPYFRSTVDETSRVQNLQFPQEALSSHTVHSIPASTIAMVQQQQTQQLTQMYPQVHVSHYANLMPYRQFVSPFYVPPMAVPGYSSNAAYPHPSNGNSYLLMPGGSSHLSANGVKYGIQQFKPVPTGSPTGFGNFSNGYAINAPGVGGAAGLEDSSGLKFKDRSMYVPNPQAETSEIWMSSRDLPSMQSGSYYNMPGQTTHASYLPSHTSHASFNAAGQSSHMQFPSMYHPQQPAGIPSPHHLSPAMGGNIGVGVAAGGTVTQVNAYQQPQVGHMNWTGKY